MSYVYFIGPKERRPSKIKIGKTGGNPVARLSGLQTGSPDLLKVFAFIQGGRFLEDLLHVTFAPVRIHGEWFRMEGRLLALVSQLYDEKGGAEAHTEDEFARVAAEIMTTDYPPPATFCNFEEWMDSANTGPIGDWMHDTAWAAYQAKLAKERGE